MKSKLSLILTSSAVMMTLALPTLAAIQLQGAGSGLCGGICAKGFSSDTPSDQVIPVSGDDDDGAKWLRRGHDHDDDEDCDDDDDDDECAGAKGNPAPAGAVNPPANGLFGTGARPVVITH